MSQNIREILIYLTLNCNYSCKMCTQNGLRHYAEMDTEKWDNIFADIKRDYPDVFLIFLGGEPLLHKEFDKIINSATKNYLKKHVITNGSLLNKERLWFLKENYCGMTISLDGLWQTHDKIRNANGAYQKVIESLKIMHDFNQSAKKEEKRFFYDINYVMLPENIDETKDFIKEISKYKPTRIMLNHTRYASFEKREEMKDEIEKIFKNPYSHHLMMRSNIEFSEDYIKKMNEIVNELKNSYPDFVVEIPDFSEEERLAYYDDERVYDLKPNWRCASPYKIPTILPDGTVLSCLYNNLGNVNEQTLSELWQNEIAQTTRDYLDKNKKFLACGRCTCYYKPEDL